MNREELLERATEYAATMHRMATITSRLARCLPDVAPEELAKRYPTVDVPTDLVRQLREMTARQHELYKELTQTTLQLANEKPKNETYQ